LTPLAVNRMGIIAEQYPANGAARHNRSMLFQTEGENDANCHNERWTTQQAEDSLESEPRHLGAIATIPSVQMVQVLARAGLDWILIDMEHGAITADMVHAMIAATSGTALVPLVRVADASSWQAKLPLDLGALGICFPMTSTRAAAEEAVRAVRYPPLGERCWGPFYAPLRWDLSMQEYLLHADAEVLAIGTIEHVDALKCISEIVSTPGLDVAFIGPGDLATSMGLRGEVDRPEVLAVINTLEKSIRNSPVILGGVATTPDQANDMIERGYRALVVGFDWSLLQRGIMSAIQGIRRADS
jgi:4-hydroxy-2-oxoheptanedioate aldolase